MPPASLTDSIMDTEKLLLRSPEPGDAPLLFAFLGDRSAMRFTQARSSLEDCVHYLEVHESQRETVGCAPWTIIGKAEGEIVGFGGLYEDPFDPGWGVELAYFFRPESWGKGYATELAGACLAHARRERRWPTICAFTHADNKASSRVLEKVGFARRRYVSEMDRWLYGYDIS